jgi:hypothetical protein
MDMTKVRKKLCRELKKLSKGKCFVVVGAPLDPEVLKFLKRMAREEKEARKAIIMVD